MKKTTYLLSATLLTTLLATGCSTTEKETQAPSPSSSAQHDSQQKATPRDESNLSLEQVKSKAHFALLLPASLPHEMKFQTATASFNSTDGKLQELALIYKSPDNKYSMTVQEQEGSSFDMPNYKELDTKLYGQHVQYIKSQTNSALVFCNGKVVCTISTTNSDIGTEDALLEIAKQFKS